MFGFRIDLTNTSTNSPFGPLKQWGDLVQMQGTDYGGFLSSSTSFNLNKASDALGRGALSQSTKDYIIPMGVAFAIYPHLSSVQSANNMRMGKALV